MEAWISKMDNWIIKFWYVSLTTSLEVLGYVGPILLLSPLSPAPTSYEGLGILSTFAALSTLSLFTNEPPLAWAGAEVAKATYKRVPRFLALSSALSLTASLIVDRSFEIFNYATAVSAACLLAAAAAVYVSGRLMQRRKLARQYEETQRIAAVIAKSYNLKQD